MGYLTTARSRPARFLMWLGVPLLVLVGVGLSTAFIDQPLYISALVVAVGGLFMFLRSFEQKVIGILLMRSALDLYSVQQVPAAFAIGVDLLVVFYLCRQLLLRQPIHTDRFFWVLFGWVALQSIWVALNTDKHAGRHAFYDLCGNAGVDSVCLVSDGVFVDDAVARSHSSRSSRLSVVA